MKKLLVSLAAVAALSTAAFAANSQTGCGLGTMVIKKADSAIMYALQANYNNIYASQSVEMADVLDNISTTAI